MHGWGIDQGKPEEGSVSLYDLVIRMVPWSMCKTYTIRNGCTCCPLQYNLRNMVPCMVHNQTNVNGNGEIHPPTTVVICFIIK